MSLYVYDGFDAGGVPVAGKIEAVSEEEARFVLEEQRIHLQTLALRWWTRELGPARVPKSGVAMFTRLMASLMRSGLRPREALEVLREEMPGTPLKRVLYDLAVQVQRGVRLSDAARCHPRVFSGVYCAALAAGEDAGSLRRVMERLSLGLQHAESTRRKVVGALTYPAVVLAIVGVVGAGLLYFVVPQFAAVLLESGGELPALTRMLLGASAVTRAAGPVALAAGLGGSLLLRAALRRNEALRTRFHGVLLRLPIFGHLILCGGMANFARIFALLHSSHSNVVDAVRLAADTVPNLAIRGALYTVGEGHAGGRPLSEEMRRGGIVPPIMIAMTTVGERSGSLSQQMESAADFYEEELGFQVDRLTALLGPVLIVLAFGPVVCLVIGIYVPMIQAVRALG